MITKWICAALLGCSALLVPSASYAATSSELNLVSPPPAVIPPGVSSVPFTVALPSSLVLPANSVLNWGTYAVTFQDDQGNFANTTGQSNDVSLLRDHQSDFFAVKVDPFGRQATFTANAQFAGTYTVVAAASLGSSLYHKTLVLKFSPAGSFVPMPILGSGLHVEVENPDPGSDQQTTIRARIVVDPATYMDFSDPFNLGNTTANISNLRLEAVIKSDAIPSYGQSLEPGVWQNFVVNAPDYFANGFGIKAFWTLNGTPNSDSPLLGQEFSKMVPVTINFKPAPIAIQLSHSKVKMTLSFPHQVTYGRSYVAKVSIAQKLNGACSFYLYNASNSLMGTSSMRNGRATLQFAIAWNTPGNFTGSLKAVCTAGKVTSVGSTTLQGKRQ